MKPPCSAMAPEPNERPRDRDEREAWDMTHEDDDFEARASGLMRKRTYFTGGLTDGDSTSSAETQRKRQL